MDHSTNNELPPFDKYFYYHESVQSSDTDAEFMFNTYKEIRGREPKHMREDFCGTYSISCEWVKLDPANVATGVDIDPEPIQYGTDTYLPKLDPDQQGRIKIIESNVLSPELPKADVICAFNFSYMGFKDRTTLKQYLQCAYDSLEEDGIFTLDIFGGSETQEANEDETEYEDEQYSYFWDQTNFNPINYHAKFHIHFQREGEEKRENVFTYDWRIWTVPEIRDVMTDVGFKTSQVYWEGTDEDGDGDGVFTLTEEGEDCESWVAYVVGVK